MMGVIIRVSNLAGAKLIYFNETGLYNIKRVSFNIARYN